MVYGVLRLLNFAHSEVFTFGAFAGYFTLKMAIRIAPGYPTTAILVSMMSAGIGAGILAVIIERIAYRPIRALPKVSVLLSAIGVSILLQNIGIKIFGAHTRAYPDIEMPISPKVLAVIVLAITFSILYVFVFHTKNGIKMRAVSEDPVTARLMGINPESVIILAFFLGGFFAGIGGVVWGLLYSSIDPQMGFSPGLKAFIIAVIGSIGSLNGTFLMGISLGVLESLLLAYLPSSLTAYKDAIVFIILITLLIIRPTGLYGKIKGKAIQR